MDVKRQNEIPTELKENLEIALWERVKSTYPSGTSKHTNALLEEDFNDFIEQAVKLCTIHHVVDMLAISTNKQNN